MVKSSVLLSWVISFTELSHYWALSNRALYPVVRCHEKDDSLVGIWSYQNRNADLDRFLLLSVSLKGYWMVESSVSMSRFMTPNISPHNRWTVSWVIWVVTHGISNWSYQVPQGACPRRSHRPPPAGPTTKARPGSPMRSAPSCSQGCPPWSPSCKRAAWPGHPLTAIGMIWNWLISFLSGETYS